jgi:colicin import membrane protein
MTDRLEPGVRREPGRWASVGLSIAMHALLVGLLIYGIRWQTRAPEAVEVELVPEAVRQPPHEIVRQPEPQPERPPEPPPRIAPRPEPKPAPPPKPESRTPPPKPEIAVKEPVKKPSPQQPKVEPETPVPPKPAPRVQRRELIDEQLQRETEQLQRERILQEASLRAQVAREQQLAAARDQAKAEYIARVRAKIRGNIVLPPDLRGNPEAVFEVAQLPSGEVLPPLKLKRSSGIAALDAAIERAILKSSPLPKAPQPELFSRVLELRFRPLEEP